MKQVEERYISLLTDFGFKRIFGTAMNKDLLICFLNSLFNGRQVVKDVKYLNPEHVLHKKMQYFFGGAANENYARFNGSKKDCIRSKLQCAPGEP